MSEALAAEVAPFNIRVLLVELGSFRTNFLAGGAMQVAEPSTPYQLPHAVAASIQDEHDKNGKQPGDPQKAVAVIHDAVTGQNEALAKVLRLPLGNDCWEVGIQHMDQVRRDFEASKSVAFTVKVEE
jgi:NAD(P)-dependent dehydrogenase (short-subunit alcohol dehydrogenase family)